MYKNKRSGAMGTVITVIILILLVILTNVNRDNLSYAEGFATSIIMPIQNAFTILKHKVTGDMEFFSNLDTLKKENEELKAQNKELETQVRELEVLKAENSKLQEYANLSEKYQEYETIPAYVIDKDVSNYSSNIVINAGSKQGIEKNMDEYYIFRTAWLYGIGGNNFVKTMTKLGSTRDEINVVSDQHGSPTYAKDLTEIIYQAIEKQIPYGIYNATNEGYTTWYEFTKEILSEQGINCKVNPVTTDEYIEMMKITQAKRPFNSQMSKAKLESCGIKVPEWKDGLKRYLEEVKENEE